MNFEPIYCPNDRCPKYRDTGTRKVLSKRSPDTTGTLEMYCARCKQVAVIRVGVLVRS